MYMRIDSPKGLVSFWVSIGEIQGFRETTPDWPWDDRRPKNTNLNQIKYKFKYLPIETQNQLKPFGESIRMYISCPELYLQANRSKGADTA